MKKYLLHLYPRVWRERYGDELLAMLDERSLSFTDGLNLFFGALDAQLHPHLGLTGMNLYERIIYMVSTLRRSLLAIFCSYVSFILAGLAFQKMTESSDFFAAAQAYAIVGLSFNFVVIGAIVGLLAVITGGLPIVIAVVKSAFARKRYSPLFLLALPILAFAVFLGTLFLLKATNPTSNQIAPLWQLIIFFGVLIISAIVSTGSVCFAIVRSEVSENPLRFAILPSILATVSMVLILAATISWGWGLYNNMPQLFASNNGLVGTSTTGTWLGIIIAMAIAALVALISLFRGLSAHSALNTTTA